MTETKKYPFILAPAEYHAIIGALAVRPYREVAGLVQNLQDQAKAHEAADGPTKPPAPPADKPAIDTPAAPPAPAAPAAETPALLVA